MGRQMGPKFLPTHSLSGSSPSEVLKGKVGTCYLLGTALLCGHGANRTHPRRVSAPPPRNRGNIAQAAYPFTKLFVLGNRAFMLQTMETATKQRSLVLEEVSSCAGGQNIQRVPVAIIEWPHQ